MPLSKPMLFRFNRLTLLTNIFSLQFTEISEYQRSSSYRASKSRFFQYIHCKFCRVCPTTKMTSATVKPSMISGRNRRRRRILALGLCRLGHRNSCVSIGPKNKQKKPTPFMIQDCELELNFPLVPFFMLCWQALTVAPVISIVWLDFSKICLPLLSTTASLMFCRFAKFLPKRKTWGRTRQRPAMTDFHRKVNKFWRRFAKCDTG